MSEGLANYLDAMKALRLRAIVNGEVIPRENEPIDIVLLAAINRRPDRGFQQIGDVAKRAVQDIMNG